MITREMIERINELSRKQRSGNLTDEEKSEQALLRRQYIDNIKGQIRSQLDASAPAEHGTEGSCGCPSGCKH